MIIEGSFLQKVDREEKNDERRASTGRLTFSSQASIERASRISRRLFSTSFFLALFISITKRTHGLQPASTCPGYTCYYYYYRHYCCTHKRRAAVILYILNALLLRHCSSMCADSCRTRGVPRSSVSSAPKMSNAQNGQGHTRDAQ